VVITAAVGAAHPEVAAAERLGIPVIKRARLLADLANPRREIAVAGTHGKSTTSALIGHILTTTGRDPTILIGGTSLNLGSNARLGASDLVVVEADEYDASFLHLRPAVAVITNVGTDHLDYYGTPEGVRAAFARFASAVTETLVLGADDPGLELRPAHGAVVRTYGLTAGELRARSIRQEGGLTRFTAVSGEGECEYELQPPGRHMVGNALAAICVASTLGVPEDDIRQALASFRGVARRSEIKGEAHGVLVIDDYAVHPREIEMTLAALRERYRRPIRVLFQPHTYSRVAAHFDDFARAFGDASAVYVLDIYAAREVETLGMHSRTLAAAITRTGVPAIYAGDGETAIDALLAAVESGDLVVTMGAGDVYRLGPAVLEGVKAP
jgi:UDP-N-acetylmuramate--alanine ligase